MTFCEPQMGQDRFWRCLFVSGLIHAGVFAVFVVLERPHLRTAPVAVAVTLVEVGPDYKDTSSDLIETSEHRVTSHHVRPSPHIHAVEDPTETSSGGSHESVPSVQTARGETGLGADVIEGYLQSVVQIVTNYRNYPTLAIDRNLEGRVVVAVVILADGVIESTSIQAAAQYDILNDAALGIFRRIRKFPPPPTELSPPVRLEVPIQYVINRK